MARRAFTQVRLVCDTCGAEINENTGAYLEGLKRYEDSRPDKIWLDWCSRECKETWYKEHGE